MCPTFWISSFPLSTFTSDSHTLNGPSLQCLDQRHPWYTILLDANPALLLHLVSISVHLSILVKIVLPSQRLDLGVLYHQCLTHYFEYNNGFTNYWLTDKEVSSFKPESREREVESTAQTLSVIWVTEMAGRPQDCTGSFSHRCDQILQEHRREVYSGPQCRRHGPREQMQEQFCLLASHWSGSWERGTLVLSWLSPFPISFNYTVLSPRLEFPPTPHNYLSLETSSQTHLKVCFTNTLKHFFLFIFLFRKRQNHI